MFVCTAFLLVEKVFINDCIAQVFLLLMPNQLKNTENSIRTLQAADRIPAINGLHIGKVKKIASDPEKGFRVQVTLPLMESPNEGVWARLSTFYASSG